MTTNERAALASWNLSVRWWNALRTNESDELPRTESAYRLTSSMLPKGFEAPHAVAFGR